jgi:dihydroorotase
LHLRDGPSLQLTVNAAARVFRRVIVMPNLKPPVSTAADALAYHSRIMAAVNPALACAGFQPLMTLYLRDITEPAEITRAKAGGVVHGVKLYPAGATTNSDAGVTDIKRVYPVLEEMQRLGMPLLIHGEVTDSHIDVFDREKVFIDRTMGPLLRDFPALKVVFEHITTADAAAFVAEGPATIAATITPHHLLYNRNHMLAGAVRPHFFCLPVLKRNTHQEALLAAATGGSPKFFLGTDSAPHSKHAKECAAGCAGIFNSDSAIESYAEVFDACGALERLEGFASFHGPDFYGLPRNQDRIRLRREAWEGPADAVMGSESVVPMRAGEQVAWRVVGGQQA